MASMRQAINNMCKACIYDQEAGFGTWRQQTEACTAKTCPLFDFRPIPYNPRPIVDSLIRDMTGED